MLTLIFVKGSITTKTESLDFLGTLVNVLLYLTLLSHINGSIRFYGKRGDLLRFFNTAGPVIEEKHYYVPIMNRIDKEEVISLIEQEKYFVLHAPRQSGKTTCLLDLTNVLNGSGKYKSLYINVESAQAARENVDVAIGIIIKALERSEAMLLKDDTITCLKKKIVDESGYSALESILTYWAQESELPTVLFIDEIDSLVGDTLISVLRQLRSGYTFRPDFFPQSIILCGVRDVRDYRIYSRKDKDIITGGSCFNINAKSLSLMNFSEEDIRILFFQHTEETGQLFTEEAMKEVYELTGGQPWLVNALAYEVCYEIPEGKNRSAVISVEMIREAKENLILRRVTHIDQLVDKLQEERVRKIIESMLIGGDIEELSQDDIQYSIDLGLISQTPDGLIISNPLYKEIIPRELSSVTQTRIESKVDPLMFINNTGSLNFDKLLEYFQQFFRENAESWIERFRYKEAGPQLLLQAFLQRVIDRGGRIFREYGLGLKRTDLLVEWNNKERHVVELKLLHKSLDKTIKEGMEQIYGYMDKIGLDSGHLLVFDKDKAKSWNDKIFREERQYKGKKILIWGM